MNLSRYNSWLWTVMVFRDQWRSRHSISRSLTFSLILFHLLTLTEAWLFLIGTISASVSQVVTGLFLLFYMYVSLILSVCVTWAQEPDVRSSRTGVLVDFWEGSGNWIWILCKSLSLLNIWAISTASRTQNYFFSSLWFIQEVPKVFVTLCAYNNMDSVSVRFA